MKKFLMIPIVFVLLASGCTSLSNNVNGVADSIDNQTVNEIITDVNKVEVYHFHVTRQCQGCINIGKCAEDAVNEYFQSEQESGVVVFAHINAELAENVDLVQQYGPTGSSLWFGVYDNSSGFSKEENTLVWYKTSDMEKCSEYIKGVIEGKLQGE